MSFEELTFLNCLSFTAICSTIALFFCGIPICANIWKRRSTKDISGAPFVMGLLGAAFWLRYGLLKADYTMIIVNATAVTLMSSYLIFYFIFTKPKIYITIAISAVVFLISLMAFLVEIYSLNYTIDPLGFVCMTFNIINFGAPLAGLKVVMRERNCETLPLPMCMANLLVSSQWCLYGILVADIYITMPNAIGVSLALVQVSLFLIFPMKSGQKALLRKICGAWKHQIDANREEDKPKRSWIVDVINNNELMQPGITKSNSFNQLPALDSASLDSSSIATEITEFGQSHDSSFKYVGSCTSTENVLDIEPGIKSESPTVVIYANDDEKEAPFCKNDASHLADDRDKQLLAKTSVEEISCVL